MQVSVEAGEGLERKLKIHIPKETVETQVESRLKSMLPRVKIDGFRPGKAPLKVVKQHYGEQVFQEVAGELIQNSFRDALTQENLNPAGDPSIATDGIKQGEPLEFTATFEVYPEVELAPISGMKLERITSSVTDADIDKMIETLRKQRSTWSEVDRASADEDRVTIDFKGMVDGEAFDGGSAESVSTAASIICSVMSALKRATTSANWAPAPSSVPASSPEYDPSRLIGYAPAWLAWFSGTSRCARPVRPRAPRDR